jgi:NADH dehydrogenase
MADRLDDQGLATVFGGSGFVGRYAVTALAREGWRIRAAVRRPDLAGFLQPAGRVGQVFPVQANVRYADSVARALQGAKAVVNAVGVLASSGRQSFKAIHVEGPRAMAKAAREAGVERFVHISAIGADAKAQSRYARSKGEGEAAVLAEFPGAVILRPSIVFGPEDHFFNRFAAMARLSPVLPLIGGGETRFQPVYVGDVAEAVARSVDGDLKGGTIYELGGPEVLTFRQCMEEMLRVIGRRRILVNMPWSIARMQASVLGLLPKPLLTTDQVIQLGIDNLVSAEAVKQKRTLEGIGIAGETVGTILPSYLWRYRVAGQYTRNVVA